MGNTRGHASTSTARPNIHEKKTLILCIWWNQLGVVYYELLKQNETINGALYRTQLMILRRVLKGKRSHYTPDTTKLFSCMIMLLHFSGAGQNLFKNTHLGNSTHAPYSTDIAPLDCFLFRSMAHELSQKPFTSHERYEKFSRFVDTLATTALCYYPHPSIDV
ncbi:mariner Mos1 transposase [Trichonephila clavipes]|uniref:Mariner Mos1 transposase n=1 Tax=Trichonephila clavipes TaxID=2585209 RepID=A0A8X6UZT2_TRICX|nr:mariner Mos1 transposase [Trichonephila clavipes]